jgi:hypothetical protein
MSFRADRVSSVNNMGVAVFFTRGMSIEEWNKAGLLEREMVFYR